MRLLLDQRSYDEMLNKPAHPRDCYVRGDEYLHHLYADGVKYLVAALSTIASSAPRMPATATRCCT